MNDMETAKTKNRFQEDIPLGRNIFQLRRLCRMTQEDLAKQLHVSCQAVSKWENGQSIPDALLLPQIAAALQTSIDTLMGFIPKKNVISPYEERYQKEGYYWGIEPNDLAFEVLKRKYPTRPLRLLEIGCGEGRDAVFFAKNGFIVTAFDATESGIEKAKRLAEIHGVEVNFFKADLRQFRAEETYDVIYSSGVFHHMPPKLREEIFENYRNHTSPGGLNAANVFVRKPYIPVPPDSDGDDDTWESGELAFYYRAWQMEVMKEEEFVCKSGAAPHSHCMNVVIAKKPE